MWRKKKKVEIWIGINYEEEREKFKLIERKKDKGMKDKKRHEKIKLLKGGKKKKLENLCA